MIHDPLTKLQCSPTSDGSACAIVASESYVDSHDLWGQAIEIAGQSMITDLSSTFAEDTDCMKIVGSDMSKTGGRAGLRRGRGRGRGDRRLRAARLLQRQRADHLRSARLRGGGRGPQAGRGGSDHLRRQGRRQPLRRADLQGPPARGDRARAVLGADLAAARRSRQAPGRRGQGGPATQHRPRRRRRGHRLQAGGLRTAGAEEVTAMAKERRSLSGKVVAITGGARGIGKATATALVRKGCRVAIGDLDLGLAEETAAELGGGTSRCRSTSPTAPRSPRFLDEAETPARPARRPGQQRRDHAGDPVRRGGRRLDPPPARHQPLRRHRRLPAGDRADAAARHRPHRQHRLLRRQGRRPGDRHLLGDQARRRRPLRGDAPANCAAPASRSPA